MNEERLRKMLAKDAYIFAKEILEAFIMTLGKPSIEMMEKYPEVKGMMPLWDIECLMKMKDVFIDKMDEKIKNNEK